MPCKLVCGISSNQLRLKYSGFSVAKNTEHPFLSSGGGLRTRAVPGDGVPPGS